MSLKITARGFELPDSLEQKIKEECFKLDKFNIDFSGKDVFMKLENGHEFTVEIATRSDLGKIDSTASAHELMDAFNEAFARLETQIIKHKEKPVSHRSEHATAEKEHLIEEEDATLAKL